jgi:hypothetical protein
MSSAGSKLKLLLFICVPVSILVLLNHTKTTSNMASTVWDAPVFEYFKTFDYGIAPTTTKVGEINSLADYQALVPGSEIRVEIERNPGSEEIRVVQDSNGDYHATTSPSVAQQILKVIDAETSDLFQFDIKAYPDIPAGEEKVTDQMRHIIRYDENKKRLLPGIKKAGTLSTMEEYKAKETGSVWVMEEEEFVGITDTANGDVWYVTEELKREILDRKSKADLSCPLYSDEEDGEGEKDEQDQVGA